MGRPSLGYTQIQAAFYFDKHGLRCSTPEEYERWFILAERAQQPCRKLTHFCDDCTLAFKKDAVSNGTCVLEDRKQLPE